MRKITFFFLTLLAITLTGCLDTVEEISVNANGTGVYRTTMDMSGMFDMIEMMAAMDTSANGQLKKLSEKDIDSVMNLRSFTDTSSTLTAEQKALFHDATMHMIMKQEDKVFKITMSYPFKNLADVQKIIDLNSEGKGVDLLGKNKNDSQNVPGMESKGGFPSINNYYDVTIKNGLIERKVNEEKLTALKNDEQLKEMKGAEDMMSSITYNTIIHLPRAAKKAEGEKIKLSADKKTVTIKSTLMDLFDDPKSLGFAIEY
jgi:hypothetical protein